MNKRIGTYKEKKAFRFIRWSRRAAASFHSIGREVSIGCLHANVINRLSLKNDTLSGRGERLCHLLFPQTLMQVEGEDPPLEENLIREGQLLSIHKTSGIPHSILFIKVGGGGYTLYPYNNAMDKKHALRSIADPSHYYFYDYGYQELLSDERN